MKLAITEQEWRVVLDRARDVGGGLGGTAGEGAAIVVARACLEALGMTVPVLVDELDPGPRSVSTVREARSVSTEPDPPVVREPMPARDLRVSARTLGAVDGYCDHCLAVIPASQLAASTGGDRLCPRHGRPVRDLVEVAEGRFEVSRLPGEPQNPELPADVLCAAPIGSATCVYRPGHLGRHSPRRSGRREAAAPPAPARNWPEPGSDADNGLTADDHAGYPHEDHPGGHE